MDVLLIVVEECGDGSEQRDCCSEIYDGLHDVYWIKHYKSVMCSICGVNCWWYYIILPLFLERKRQGSSSSTALAEEQGDGCCPIAQTEG